ncbi:MAG: hypothetical protein KAS32_29410 [Candidatus Peribacteraceae bacterium]|nr:hypothetical protein [Candidatus Peribacteraceae bacterium]
MSIDERRKALVKILENTAEVCDKCGNPLIHSAMALDDGDNIEILCFMCHPSTKEWVEASIRNAAAKYNYSATNAVENITYNAESKTMNINLTITPVRSVESVQVSLVAPEGVTVEDIQDAIDELDSETVDELE